MHGLDAWPVKEGRMTRKRQQKSSKIVSQKRTSDRYIGWPIRIGVGITILSGIGLVLLTILQHTSTSHENISVSERVKHSPITESEPPPGQGLTDGEIRAAANQLFWAVSPSLPENRYFSPFAKQKLLWIITEKQAGKLSLILLKNVDSAGLIADDLMASGRPEGKPIIVISQPSFLDFLLDGGRIAPPFSQQQRNDFAIGLVHEVVHLENPNLSNITTPQERFQEELRAWRVVDLNVVRQLRELHQPMNHRLIEADDAIRSCGDSTQCEPLRAILMSSYGSGSN
jgi:hypothetical protein